MHELYLVHDCAHNEVRLYRWVVLHIGMAGAGYLVRWSTKMVLRQKSVPAHYASFVPNRIIGLYVWWSG